MLYSFLRLLQWNVVKVLKSKSTAEVRGDFINLSSRKRKTKRKNSKDAEENGLTYNRQIITTVNKTWTVLKKKRKRMNRKRVIKRGRKKTKIFSRLISLLFWGLALLLIWMKWDKIIYFTFRCIAWSAKFIFNLCFLEKY